jgi:hypothetical protein
MNKLSTHGNRGRGNKGIIPLLSACILCGVFAGCASTPKAPTEALQAAELAIAKAEQDRASNYASLELGEAREKLTSARVAVAEKEMLRAARLAEQSRADAELAIAKTQSAKAQEVNAELDKNADTLQRELERNSGGAL